MFVLRCVRRAYERASYTVCYSDRPVRWLLCACAVKYLLEGSH